MIFRQVYNITQVFISQKHYIKYYVIKNAKLKECASQYSEQSITNQKDAMPYIKKYEKWQP